MFERRSTAQRSLHVALGLAVLCGSLGLHAQTIDRRRGADAVLDYAKLAQIGPWDDRNYALTRADLAYLAPNESELRDPIPVFFRVEMRKRNPGMQRSGPAQYPRSAYNHFMQKYGGYLYAGKLYREAERTADGRFELVLENGVEQEVFEAGGADALSGEVRVTSPNGGAETAIKIHPADPNKVVAGSNGPGGGQKMHYSTNGGSTWASAAALPQGSTCCDPTVDWSSNGQFAYASALGLAPGCCDVWVYRSGDGGATWNNLETLTPGDPRRELSSGGISDKQYMHVDKFATSPFKDNIYMSWHDNNVMKFSRSTDFANTWSTALTLSSGANQSGIGSDLTTDKSGNVYYFWPATTGKTILMRKSTNGGGAFNAAVTVANTQDGYDFAIPAMETRRAFIYVSADADVTNGPFANRIYAAWTDATAPESATTANNHGRIQVGRSSDGGATWQITTPHETADANSVDRFHPWLSVGPDGKVYVIFYDTRRVANRTGVDLFYSVSADGGVTFGAPQRLTSVISANITDSFEWGDYNGLDVVMNQLIAIYTDNRKEGAETGNSVDAYAIGALVGGTTPDFAVACSPASVSAVAGGNATSTCTVTSTGGFNSAVALSCGGLPAGVSCAYSPASVTPPANGSVSATLTVSVLAGTAAGTSAFQANGTSGATVRSANLSLTVTSVPTPDFAVACSPASVSAAAGGSATSTCTVTSTGGFNSAVALSCSAQPAGVSCAYSPASVTPPANGSVTATLTISVAAGTAAGTSSFQARGTSGATVRNANVTLTITGAGGGAQTATFDATLRAPKCAVVGSSCDSGAALLLGRGTRGPEPNQPNTIAGTCADGNAGTFHVDESNDRLKVSTVDGTNLAAGKQVRIEATVWAWTTPASDKLDLYFAANANSPTWTFVTTLTPTVAGAQTLSATYTLPAGALQAVRAQFRYQSAVGTCSTGTYNDRDDLIFAVQ